MQHEVQTFFLKKMFFHYTIAMQKSHANQKEKLTWLCKIKSIPQQQRTLTHTPNPKQNSTAAKHCKTSQMQNTVR